MKGTVNSAIPGIPVGGTHRRGARARLSRRRRSNVTIAVGAQRGGARRHAAAGAAAGDGAAARGDAGAQRRGVHRRRVGGAGAVRSQRSGAGQALRHRARARLRRVEARGRSRSGGSRRRCRRELSASGTVKVLSNVSGAAVIIDGQLVGKTPVVARQHAGRRAPRRGQAARLSSTPSSRSISRAASRRSWPPT